MKKPASTAVPLNDILTHRWSPRSFDSQHEISQEDVVALLEAARWAPSSNNGQPWRFIVARRGEENFTKLIETMAGFNKMWTPATSLLIAIVAKVTNEDGTPRPVSLYDSGIASALLTVEAMHRGLAVHQIGGFEKLAFSEAFGLDNEHEPVIILAIGKQSTADALENEALQQREIAPRERKPLEELVISGLHSN
jgi:nitroreductase